MPWSGNTSLFSRLFLQLSWQADPQVQRTLDSLPAEAIVVDLGAGGRRISDNVICVDMSRELHPDLISDGHVLALRSDSVDCVICTGVLEHVRWPQKTVAEIHRVLKPGGLVHIEVPFLVVYHPDPIDCWRWTHQGLSFFMQDQGFEEIRSGTHIGPTSALVSLMDTWLAILTRRKPWRTLTRALFRVPLALLKFTDGLLLTSNIGTKEAAYAVFYVGRKPVKEDRYD